MDVAFDVGVVGGGVLALNTALEIVKKDSNLRVAIFRPSTSLGAASLAAGAMLGCFSEITGNTFKSDYGKEKFSISLQALKRWSDLLAELDSEADSLKHEKSVTAKGTCILQNTDSGVLDDINYQSIISSLDKFNVGYERIDPNSIDGYYPIDSSRSLNAIYIPDEHAVDPSIIIKKFEAVLQKHPGVTFVDCKIHDLICEGSTVKGVIDTENQHYACHKVVLAAGVFSQSIIDKTDLRYRIPRLYSGVGNAYTAKLDNNYTGTVPKHILRTPNRSFACGLHVVPRAGREIYVGATNNVAGDPAGYARIDMIKFITESVIKQINRYFHSAEFVQLLCGNRPVSLDTFPLIGSTSINGFYLATGTYRDGLEQAPYVAEYMSHLVLERSLEEGEYSEFASFQPERYPISVFTKEEAIEEAVQHYIAGIYEHNTVMPLVGLADQYEHLLRCKITQLYEEFSGHPVFAPDFFLMLDLASYESVRQKEKEILFDFYEHARREYSKH